MEYYKDNHITVYNQDCRQMSNLPDESVQCVVTSPPYWGLRKYSGNQELIWGGDKDCVHKWGEENIATRSGGGWNNPETRDRYPTMRLRSPDKEGQREVSQGNFCQLCSAWRGSHGLEPTPEMYVHHTIELLREIRRVLRKDGVVFWNIGDSYVTNPSNGRGQSKQGEGGNPHHSGMNTTGLRLQAKQLNLVPFRVAIAAQEDGWWVRSDIIWSKPNPMPESVTDRPTNSHEHVLMLTKSAKYYWDQEAVREPVAESTIGRGPVDFGGAKGRDYQPAADDPQFRNGSEQWGRTYKYNGSGRNIRSVWEFPTQPYPDAHFSVFPEKLPEICIKAATPEEGCCSECGAPWERIVEVSGGMIGEGWNDHQDDQIRGNRAANKAKGGNGYKREKKGWQPGCKCNADKVPSTVLDCFAGAGTTLWVAKKLNRHTVGYELSQEYCDLIVKRNSQQVLT